MGRTCKVNLTLDHHLWMEFNKLRDEMSDVLGSRIEFSPYANSVLRQMVDTMRVFLKKKREGTLTAEFIKEHFRKLAEAEGKKVEREANKMK